MITNISFFDWPCNIRINDIRVLGVHNGYGLLWRTPDFGWVGQFSGDLGSMYSFDRIKGPNACPPLPYLDVMMRRGIQPLRSPLKDVITNQIYLANA